MANEMAQRMAQDGISPDTIVQGTGAERSYEQGGVPGNEGMVPPSAGTSNTDMAPGGTPSGGPPDNIPYARFKEVNDRLAGLRGYEELASYGYDADSMRRLASFEQQYQADPIGVWRSMATNLDLPQELMDAINSHTGQGPSTPQQAEGQTDRREQNPLPVSADDRRRLDYVDQIIARDDERQKQDQLDRVLAAWDEMDNRDGIQTSRRTQLTYIASMASRRDGQAPAYRTVEGLADAARSARMEDRDFDLGNLVNNGNVGQGMPPALPGSLPAPAGPLKFRDLREASRAAEADLRAGRLSPLT
jgi:hypothetical protein